MARSNLGDAGLTDGHSEDVRESDLDEDEEGMSGNDTDDMCDSVYEEHRKTQAEKAAKRAVPYQRYGHTVVAYNSHAYLWGGLNDDYDASSTLHEYDPVENKWSIVEIQGLHPPSRDAHTAVVWNDRMYVFGGFEAETQRFSRETYYFDFLTKAWTQVVTEGKPPRYRDLHTACVIDGKMWVFGGRSDITGPFHSSLNIYCDRLRCLDLRTKRWSTPKVTGDRPCGRRSHSAWVYNDEMYIFGGYISTRGHLNDTYAFNPTTGHWRRIEPAGTPPLPRRRQCTVVLAERVFLFGGTMPQNTQEAANMLQEVNELLRGFLFGGPTPQHTQEASNELLEANELLELGDLHVLDIAPNADPRLFQTVVEMSHIV